MNVTTMIIGLLAVPALCAALAGGAPAHATSNAPGGHGDRHDLSKGPLVEVVRQGTRRFRDLAVAEAEGYELHFGCVSSPDEGAMGLHFVNMERVADIELDPELPEIVIYEPLGDGRVRLIGADFLVLADAWHADNVAAPEIMGQLMHLIPSPNRYGLPDFYTLHVWAWKPNPNGAFVNWHPNVSCAPFDGIAH